MLALEQETSGYVGAGLFRRDETLRSPLLPELTIPLDEVFE